MPRRPDALAALILLSVASGAVAAADTNSCPVPAHEPASKPAPVSPGATGETGTEGQRDLDAWSDDENRSPAARLRTSDVAAVLAGLGKAPPERGKSWWERLREALDEWLLQQARHATAPQWLRDLLGRITPGMVEIFFWLVLATLVVSLGILVIVELRAAGLSRRKPRATPARSAAAARRDEPRVLSVSEIAALPLRAQPAALMRAAVQRLTARNLLAADESCTNGEWVRALEQRAAPEAELLRGLARAVDTTVYGGLEPRADELSELRAGTAALLAIPA